MDMDKKKGETITSLLVAIIIAVGLITFTVAGDSRTVARCNRVEDKVEKNEEKINGIQQDLKVLIAVQEVKDKETLDKAREIVSKDSL